MKRAVFTMFILAFITNLGFAEMHGGTQGTETKQKGHLQDMKEKKEMMTPEKLNESMKEMTQQMSEMMQKMTGKMTDMSSDKMNMMSKMMQDMSVQMHEMSLAMGKGTATKHTNEFISKDTFKHPPLYPLPAREGRF